VRRTNSFTLKTADFGDLQVEVFELRPLDLLEVHKTAQEKKESGLPLGEYERLLPLCTNLTKEQLMRLYPSEFAEVFRIFKEVNRDFLAPWPTLKNVFEKVGLGNWLVDLLNESGFLNSMKTAISLDLRKLSASFPSEGTSGPSATGGGISPSSLTLEEEPSPLKEKQQDLDSLEGQELGELEVKRRGRKLN